MKGKFFGILTIFLLGVLALSSVASATITISEVELDDDSLSATSTNFVRDVERGESFEVKVHLMSDVDVDDVQVEAEIRGYDHDDRMEDITSVFDMKANVTYVKKLSLDLKDRMDQDRYKLRVQVEDRNSPTVEQTYELEVDAPRHKLLIKDVIFSPDYEVRSGRALLTTVRVQNVGEKDEEGVKVKVSIPELGISASDYIDELERDGDDDDETSSEELYMRIPTCAEAGEYTVKVEAEYDDGDEKTTRQFKINVVQDDSCSAQTAPAPTTNVPQTVITIGQETQEVAAGEGGAVFPITISNAGMATKTYTVSVDGVQEWGSSRVSPSNVVILEQGETKAVYVYVTASENAAPGEKMFSVTVKSGDETLKQIPFKASVSESESSSWNKLKKGLEVGLVVLVVLLVILGLIIGFNKLKGDEEDDTEESTYY